MNAQVYIFQYLESNPVRLDVFLAEQLPDLSRSRTQALIKTGNVLVNGAVPRKTGHALEAGDEIQVTLPPVQPSGLAAEDIPLDVLFENSSVLVINKPAGLVVHPAPGHGSGTLVNAVLAHAPEIEGIGGEQRPGIVHRLDKDTSGVILVAKNDRAHQFLQEQFRTRQVQKTYLALVDGIPPTPQGVIEAAIARDNHSRDRMALVAEHRGRMAVTEYATLESFPQHTLLEAHPVTGRTHQIRLHLAFLGTPVVGDRTYGRKKSSLPINRHFLHAYRIVIRLPGEEQPRTFIAPIPEELEKILQSLRRNV